MIDELLNKYFRFKNLEYNDKGELLSIEYKTDFKYSENINVKFDLKTSYVRINGNVLPELLELILEKCEELGYKKEIK